MPIVPKRPIHARDFVARQQAAVLCGPCFDCAFSFIRLILRLLSSGTSHL